MDDAAKGKKLEFAGQVPRFTQPEIFFLSTLLTDKNSKEVGVGENKVLVVSQANGFKYEQLFVVRMGIYLR